MQATDILFPSSLYVSLVTTLETEANLSLSLQKGKHFSLWVNKEATEQPSEQGKREAWCPLVLPARCFSQQRVDGAFPTHRVGSIQLASRFPHSSVQRPSEHPRETQSPQGACSQPTRKPRVEPGLPTVQWEPPRFFLLYFSFFSPPHFLEPVQGRSLRSISPSFPPAISVLSTGGLFSPTDSDHQSQGRPCSP